jgi:hypothetical protein
MWVPESGVGSLLDERGKLRDFGNHMDGRPTSRMGYPPANTIPATPASTNTPALIRARPTMTRPPWVIENDAPADAVAQFNRAWLTFDDWVDAEIKLTADIVFSLGYLASLSTDHIIGLTDSRCRSLPIDLVRRTTSPFGPPSASGDIPSTPIPPINQTSPPSTAPHPFTHHDAQPRTIRNDFGSMPSVVGIALASSLPGPIASSTLAGPQMNTWGSDIYPMPKPA